MANHSVRNQTYPLLKEGKSISEICKLTNCTKGTVLRHARELKMITQERLTPRYDWDKIQSAYNEGLTPTRCMEKFGFSSNAWARAIQSGKLIPDPKRAMKRGPLNEDLCGRQFGRLTVIALQITDRSGRHWKCKCKCGNERIVSTGGLNAGTNQSCGCTRFNLGSENKHWKGYGEIGGGYWGEIQKNATKSKRKRDISFTITIQEAWNLFLMQEQKCAISGVPILMRGKQRGQRTASLDRIDSSKGYELGNVQWVHKDVNYLKMDLTMDGFLSWITTIYQHQQSYGQHPRQTVSPSA